MSRNGSRWLGRKLLLAWDCERRAFWFLPAIILNLGESLNGLQVGWGFWAVQVNWPKNGGCYDKRLCKKCGHRFTNHEPDSNWCADNLLDNGCDNACDGVFGKGVCSSSSPCAKALRTGSCTHPWDLPSTEGGGGVT